LPARRALDLVEEARLPAERRDERLLADDVALRADLPLRARDVTAATRDVAGGRERRIHDAPGLHLLEDAEDEADDSETHDDHSNADHSQAPLVETEGMYGAGPSKSDQSPIKTA